MYRRRKERARERERERETLRVSQVETTRIAGKTEEWDETNSPRVLKAARGVRSPFGKLPPVPRAHACLVSLNQLRFDERRELEMKSRNKSGESNASKGAGPLAIWS